MRAVAALALIWLGAVAGLAAAGAAAPPNPKSCLDNGDRKTKLTLIQKLKQNPQIVILGSSRARTATPAYLQKLTGRTGFNGGVRGGSAADEWVMTRMIASRFPKQTRRYVIFVEVGIAGDGVNPELASDSRAHPYLGSDASTRASTCHVTSIYGPDGSIVGEPSLSQAQKASRVASSAAKLVASINANPPQPTVFDPANMTYFERLIAFMNKEGARPVLVLNPIYPTVLATLRKYGFPGRQAADVYLRNLHKRADFVLVDCEDIRTWHGSTAHFDEATHVDRVNMRRMLTYIVAHSDGALG
jgi:hypothetical protein